MLKRLACLLILLGGCDLYWGGGNGDDVCYGGGYDYAAYEQRNPDTGQCETTGPDGCYDYCGPCALAGTAEPGTTDAGTAGGAPAADYNWGMCYGACSGLDESSCLATSGCHAAYLEDGGVDAGGLGTTFWACWDMPPSGPIEGGGCAGLDAQTCSEHDDCVSNFSQATYQTKFDSCAAEPGGSCATDADCGPDARCDAVTCHDDPNCPDCPSCGACPQICTGTCVPRDPMACTNVDCGPGSHCEEQCYPCDQPYPNGMNCADSCQPMCVPDQTCANIDCGPGYTCAEVCDGSGLVGGCAPACVPTGTDPGACTGTVTCGSPAPACPTGTTAGIANGCYTGYCIPESSCPLAMCESLTSESACTARSDCQAVYEGSNCTCYPDHCDCQTLTYARCETLLATPLPAAK